jgi:replicative DNA helicase
MSNHPQLPPQDLDAERGVLGAILLDARSLATALSLLQTTDFYRSGHQKIYRAMVALSDRGEAIDTVTLAEQLTKNGDLSECGGLTTLAELVAAVPSWSNIAHHCHIVKDKAIRRALIHAGHDLVVKGYEGTYSTADLLSDVQHTIFQLASGSASSGFRPANAIFKDTVADLEALALRDADVTGVPTGFEELDRLTAGWQPTDLIIIAARPSMGKTSLALGSALHAVKHHRSVGFFSLEMSAKQLMLRAISAMARIDLQRLRCGRLAPDERARLPEVKACIEPHLYIDDAGFLTLQGLRGEARRLKLRHGLDLLIVDYLQLLSGPSDAESRQQQIAEVARSLKLLAKELHVPVLALSQLNRACESRTDKRPLLADLRESGALEQDADLVLFIYRDDIYDHNSPSKGIAEILIRKHRNGPIGDLQLSFQERFSSFGDLYRA